MYLSNGHVLEWRIGRWLVLVEWYAQSEVEGQRLPACTLHIWIDAHEAIHGGSRELVFENDETWRLGAIDHGV